MKIFFFILFLPLFVKGQTHQEFWGKVNITKQLNNRWDAGIDLQYRQQSNYKTLDKDIFRYPLTRSIRSWVYYHTKNKWTFVASPIAYFVSDDLKNDLGILKKTEEIRFLGGLMKGFLIKKIKINNRLLAEHRIIDVNNAQQYSQWRYRLQNSLTIPLHNVNKTTGANYILSNEFFIKSQANVFSFDQERLLNVFQWKFKHIDVDIGYQWTIQKINKSNHHRNQWLMMTNIII